MVAIMSGVISIMEGVPARSGNWPDTWSTALETLTIALSMLVSSSNSSMTML